tara:strand:+ start:343 stop:801 length:459 start_codon:yes stop_codon:yes gene_type:complete
VPPLVKKYYEDCGKPRTTKISNFAMPKEILEALGPIPEEGQSIEDCVETIKTTFHYSMRTMHPYFNDKLYNGSNPIGHMAEYVTGVLNTASHVYHVSPVFSVMEEEVVKFFGAAYGFKNVDGVTAPGGTMAIAMSLLAARHEKFPHVRMKGW